jgi:hypothetical protein
LALLLLAVAVAIVNIPGQRPPDPEVFALAASFVMYWFLGWAGWRVARRLETRFGPTLLRFLYIVAMTGLFLLAAYAYVLMEKFYITGRIGF